MWLMTAGILRLAGLEELGHARQAARDVFRLAELARRLGQQVARALNLVAVGLTTTCVSRRNGSEGQAPRCRHGVGDGDLRVQILLVLGNHALFKARVGVHVHAHGDAFHHALEADDGPFASAMIEIRCTDPIRYRSWPLRSFWPCFGVQHASRRHRRSASGFPCRPASSTRQLAAAIHHHRCSRRDRWPCRHC